MADAINVDHEGNETISWSRALSQLENLRPAGGASGPTCWLSTVDPDGASHLTGVVGHWFDDTLYFVSGPTTQKARNLAVDSRCSFAISLPDLDLVLEGTAIRVTDSETLTSVANGFSARGWPLRVEGQNVTASFWAPTAPSPPWHLFAFTPTTGLGIATAAPAGATRWRTGAMKRT